MGKSKTDIEQTPADAAQAETVAETVAATAYPEGHNGNNRRISAMLRESRRSVDMRAINRKLKMQVARLQGELKGEK